jgi:hypothetical protein
MIPMNELQKYLRNGLLYLANVATGHYDLLIPYRYKTEEIVFVVELLIQGYFLKKRNATYGENFYGFKRSA